MSKLTSCIFHTTLVVIMFTCLASISGGASAGPAADEPVLAPEGTQEDYLRGPDGVLMFQCTPPTIFQYPWLLKLEDENGSLYILQDVCVEA